MLLHEQCPVRQWHSSMNWCQIIEQSSRYHRVSLQNNIAIYEGYILHSRNNGSLLSEPFHDQVASASQSLCRSLVILF